LLTKSPLLSLNRLSLNRSDRIFNIAGYLVCTLYALVVLIPLYYIFVSSFKETSGIYTAPLSLPDAFTFTKYAKAIQIGGLWRAIGYSVYITVAAEIVTLLLAFPAAYAIARIPVRLAGPAELLFGAGLLIPVFAMLVPVFLTMASLKLLYNPLSLIIFYPASRLSLAVILLASYLREIPREMEESAVIDGSSLFQIVVRIILPLARSGIATVIIVNFFSLWNEFLFALILLNTSTRTVQVAISTLRGEFLSDFGMIAAAVVISVVPIYLVFLFFQERIVEGLTSGAVKG
jgi:multiple sugar transport system permease protein